MRLAFTLLAASALAQTTVVLKHPETGVSTAYTLKNHPRVWADGDAGPLIAALKDPDGAGSQVSSRLSSRAGLAIQQRIPRVGDGANAAGNNALLASLWWWMNNNASKTGIGSIRDYAISKFNTVTDFHYTGGCDPAADCGDVSNDYAGEWLTDWANAYSLMRSELSSAERQSFANAMLNGINEPCEYRVQRLGTVNLTATTVTGIGTSFDSTLVGKEVYFKSTDNLSVAWRRVSSVQSSTQLTVNQSLSNQTGWYIFVLKPWTATSCGLTFFAATHGDTPPYIGKVVQTTLTAASPASNNPPPLGGFVDTLTVQASGWNPVGYTPFLIRVTGSLASSGETMLVTGVNGNTLTVRRGEWGNTRAHVSGGIVIGYTVRASISVAAQIGFGMNNRVLTRQAGFLNIAMALADDDARARALLTNAIDWFRDNSYLDARKFHTILNVSAVDYGSGRTFGHYSSIALTLKNSLSPSYDVATGNYYSNFMGKFFQYMAMPWDDGLFPRYGLEGGCGLNLMYCIPGKFIGPLMSFGLLPPAQAQATWYQYNTRTNIVASKLSVTALTGDGAVAGINTHYPMLLFDIDNAPQFDFTQTYPTAIATVSGDTDPTRGLGAFISKQDWSKNATALWGLFPHYWTDKQPSSDGLHTYMVGKKGMLIDNTDYQTASYATTYADQQTVDFGPAYKGPLSAVQGSSMLQQIDRKTIASDYFYARVNALPATNSFHNVTRFYRHFVHLKRAGQQDAIVVYDDVAKTTPERIRSFIHYVNNGQSGEGTSTLDPTGSYMESRHSAAKIQSQFFIPTGGAVKKVYDLGTSIVGGQPVVGADCSASAPCRVKLGSNVYSFTGPAGFSAGGTGTVFLYVDAAGALEAMFTTGLAAPACTGAMICVGVSADFPQDAAVRMAKLAYTNGVLAAGQCSGPLARNQFAAAAEWGTCALRNAQSRVAFMDADSTPAAEFLAVHQTTENLQAAAVPTTLLSSIDPGFDSHYVGVQIGGGAPGAVIISRAGLTISGVTRFTLNYSGSGQVLIAGLTWGSYQVFRNLTPIQTVTVADDGVLSFTATAGTYEVRFSGVLPLGIVTTSLPGGLAGVPYSGTLAAIGGTLPYTWTLVSGTLPAGLSLSAGGVISGTPTAGGTSPLRFRVTDVASQFDERDLPLTITGAQQLQVSTGSLPGGQVGFPYSATLVASGGALPYTWTIAAGSLPVGITLNAGSGGLSGSPTAAGTFAATFLVTDGQGNTASRALAIVISAASTPLQITTSSLADATAGISYTFSLGTAGGTAPYVWSAAPPPDNLFPAGMLLSAAGVVSGIPVVDASYQFEASVTDGDGTIVTALLSIVVQPSQHSPIELTFPQRSSSFAAAFYGANGLDANQACRLYVSVDLLVRDPDTFQDSGGPALRRALIGESQALQPGVPYHARVLCGTRVGSGQFTTGTDTPAATVSLPIRSRLTPALNPQSMRVDYGSSAALGDSIVGSCSPECTASLNVVTNTVVYIQRTYLDGPGNIILQSPIEKALAPAK